ncbi:MAG: hypothetical protein IT187_10805 [Geothrix sp.]|uniref:Uncharacterized protein n=2 Tax=Candidatus Geothrix odensensis TaxID=2954440 RepID=A0A936F497_9BACT|nr:hypothetical protein [Candidatus Geothrix odensensis]MCC6514495.1 hypothetical protein [Geothrix sp.]
MRRSLMFSLASLLLVPAFISCGGDAIPTTAPEAAKEPADILYHLQYLAVRKDYKHVALIAPITPDVVYPSARQLHLDAKALGLTLTPEELKGLGIEHLASKLDVLTGGPTDDYPVKDARLAFNSGIYRMTKALTAKTWGKMRHMGISDNSAGRQYGSQAVIKDMALGFDGKKVMTVSCLKKPDGTFGVTLIRWEINPKSLNQE